MTPEELSKRFLLSNVEIERMFAYFKKLETAEILFCEDHDLEYISEDGCYACRDERKDFESSVKQEVKQILCNIEPQDVDQALDSLVKDGLVIFA